MDVAGARKTHYLTDAFHFRFDNSLDPVLTVQAGDTIVFDCQEAHGGKLPSPRDDRRVPCALVRVPAGLESSSGGQLPKGAHAPAAFALGRIGYLGTYRP